MLLLEPPQTIESRYASYLLEILRSEGFAGISAAPVHEITLSQLSDHRVIVLPRGTTSSASRTMMLDFVTAGGALIAIQPDALTLHALGVEPLHAAWRSGYLTTSDSHASATGLAREPLQVPVPIEHIRVDPSTVVAWVTLTPHDQEFEPAALLMRHGAGTVVVLTFDIAHAVARLRQGDPDLAGICSSGLDGVYRPSELFAGWLDTERMRVPQADLLCALLTRLIEELSPEPRIWFFPRSDQQSVVVMTSDDDWSGPEEFDQLVEAVEARGGTATFLIVPHSRIDSARVERWRARGHAFSVHPALDSDLESYRDTAEAQASFVGPMLRDNVVRHRSAYRGEVATIRQHCARWLGYVDAALVLAELGVGMDLNFVSVYPYSAGYMAGSGRPMRFVHENGQIIDVFQQPTVWTEEALIHPDFVFSLKWSTEHAIQFAKHLLDDAANRFFTPYTINSHPVSFADYSRPLVEAVLDHAVSLSVPIVSADEWHRFVRRRDAVRLTGWEDQDGGWTLDLYAPTDIESFALLVPTSSGVHEWSIISASVSSKPTATGRLVRHADRDYVAIDVSPCGATLVSFRFETI